ncbi:hypothetical protein IO406_000732 [Campylobacter lari]|nr:hypothetical protein [Campylobacter lari]
MAYLVGLFYFLWFLFSGLVIMSFSDLSFVLWVVEYLTWLIYVFISISLVIYLA